MFFITLYPDRRRDKAGVARYELQQILVGLLRAFLRVRIADIARSVGSSII